MDYYIVRPDLDRYFPVGPSLEISLEPIVEHLRGAAPHAHWRPISLEVLSQDEYGENEGASGEPADLMDFNASGIHVISEIARARLINFFDFACDLLPVFLGEKRYYLVHVLNVLDALDIQKSEIERFASGKIKSIGNYVLKESVIADNHIFRIAGIRAPVVFVCGEFMRTVRAAELTGFLFSPVEVS